MMFCRMREKESTARLLEIAGVKAAVKAETFKKMLLFGSDNKA